MIQIRILAYDKYEYLDDISIKFLKQAEICIVSLLIRVLEFAGNFDNPSSWLLQKIVSIQKSR